MVEWRVIEKFPGYEISRDGRVRSVGRWVSNGKSRRWVEPIERKLQPHLGGYLQLKLYNQQGDGTNCFVHILVADAFIPNPENKPWVNHKHPDGDKTRNTEGNLEWSTPSENQTHKTRTLGKGRGEGHSQAKLTEPQVREILRSPLSNRAAAKAFGVCRSTIEQIRARKTWKHL